MESVFKIGFAAFVLVALGGWVANIVKFVGMLDGGVTVMFIARIAGFFLAPLGAVLGYF